MDPASPLARARARRRGRSDGLDGRPDARRGRRRRGRVDRGRAPVAERRGASPLSRRRRRRGLAASGRGPRGPVHDALGPPGLPRAAGLHGLARRGRRARHRDLDAGAVRDAQRGVEGARASRSATSGSSRRRSAARSAASGRSSTRSSRRPPGSSAGPCGSRSAAATTSPSTNPGQPFITTLRIGADAEGHFVGLEGAGRRRRRRVRRGHAPSRSRACSSPGRTPGRPSTSSAYGVRTNRFGVGAYRAPSGPPMAFALETLIDELATDLDLDPLELRRRNVVAEGEPMVDGEAWPVHGALEVLDALEASPVWRDRRTAERERRRDGREGVGRRARLLARRDECRRGGVPRLAGRERAGPHGVADMSGVAGGFQAIVAERSASSRTSSRSSPSIRTPRRPRRGAAAAPSRTRPAARSATRPRRRRSASSRRRRSSWRSPSRTWSWPTGRSGRAARPGRAIPIAKLVRANARAGRPPIEAHGHAENPGLAPSVAGHVVRVRVDRETGASACSPTMSSRTSGACSIRRS